MTRAPSRLTSAVLAAWALVAVAADAATLRVCFPRPSISRRPGIGSRSWPSSSKPTG